MEPSKPSSTDAIASLGRSQKRGGQHFADESGWFTNSNVPYAETAGVFDTTTIGAAGAQAQQLRQKIPYFFAQYDRHERDEKKRQYGPTRNQNPMMYVGWAKGLATEEPRKMAVAK